MLEKAFESLGSFPIVQAAVAILILMAGYFLIPRGEKDGKAAQSGMGTIPPWLMMGPAHDAISAIHEMNEQSRQQTELLKRIETILSELLKEVHNNTGILEAIRNESRLR